MYVSSTSAVVMKQNSANMHLVVVTVLVNYLCSCKLEHYTRVNSWVWQYGGDAFAEEMVNWSGKTVYLLQQNMYIWAAHLLP